MHGAQRAGTAPSVDHDRDVALRGTLRDRAHVDACGPERGEYFRRYAVRACHAVAHDGKDAATMIDFDALDVAVAQFGIERAAYDTLGTFSLRLGHRETDRMLGAAL